MGVFNVLALSVETSVLGWFFLAPLAAPGGSHLLAADLRDALLVRQSLALQALLSLLRLLLFVYIRRRNKRVPSTRCFVFVVSLVEVAGCALGSLQPLLYVDGARLDTFSRYRRVAWGGLYVAVLGVLAVLSTLLQLGYILQLNKSRGRLSDDKLLRDVMGDTPRAKWRRKPKDTTFEAMVRLYAHQEGAVDRLVVSSDREEEEFEFYLPQLCSFLLLGAFPRSPQLSAILLQKCSMSHVFAHKMLWYLHSYCLHNPAFATDADFQRVQMLIEDVSERERGSQVSASAQEVEALLPGSQDDHYATFQENNDLERGVATSAISSKVPTVSGVEPFELETSFLGSLANISSNLRAVAYDRRNDMLRIWLQDLEDQYLPSNSLYLPVGNSYHRLKHIHVDESFTFSTRERVPFLLCAEVVDYPSPQEELVAQQHKRRTSGVFNGRRFTLSLWDNAIDTSASGLRSTLPDSARAQTVAASIVPVTTDFDDIDSVSSISGAWSPKSDTVHSPQSESSAASPHHLARFDSTDRFLQDLSERDSKLEEDEEAESSDPSSETRHQSVGEPPCVIFKERWAEKERRIQATSPYGKLPGWRLLPVIVKSDDDLRQEQLALQLIHQFAKVFEEFKVPVFIRPYDVIAISATSGLVEAISDTISIDSLKRNDREFTTLLDFFTRHFGDPSTPEFRQARANFVSSMAGYAIVCYLLQIKDRHNGNLLLDAEGHIIHIDFGFILANNPGNMAFEQAPFKLTADFVELMGGPRSAHFRRFRSLCVRSFLVARKYRHRFVLLVEMMLHGNEHLPCFAGDPKGTVERLAARFQPDLDINSCEDFVHELIDASLDNWRTRCSAMDQHLTRQARAEQKKKIKAAQRKLQPGWKPGRPKRRKRIAATMIQRCFRSHLLRQAFQRSRQNVRFTFTSLRAFGHARSRQHWRDVDLRRLSREELRLLALTLNLPSTGKKVLLICRIQRWVDQHVLANDMAAQAAARALENRRKAQGSVYFCEAHPGADLVDIRPLRGHYITSIAAGSESDAVYALDGARARGHAMALAKAGELFSWGDNAHGALGFAAESAAQVARNRATVVGALANYQAVAAAVGGHHSIAVNSHGQLGISPSSGMNVACGVLHSMALSSDGQVYSWGCSDDGILVNLVVLTIACGAWHSACIAAEPSQVASGAGRLFTWGTGIYGQLGSGKAQVTMRNAPHGSVDGG
uniref:1-phosphatidylinositol 4-kinase n=1 Tax=Phytophthora ramorum TaxID=164328 RepID=H3HDF5_PHYRM